LLEGELVHGNRGDVDAGVVEEDIETAVLFADAREECGDAVGLTDVGGDGEHGCVSPHRGSAIEFRRAASGEDYSVSGGGEP
jgi:hypothetical protein